MSRADQCNPAALPATQGELAGGDSPPSSGIGLEKPGNEGARDRSQFQFVLTIDGQNIEKTYQVRTKDIMLEENVDHAVSVLTVRFANMNVRFTDEDLWKEHTILKLSLGYKSTGVKPRGGKWICMGPKFTYGEGREGASQEITLTAYSQEFRMGRTEKRKVWKNVRDSDIAKKIAGLYGWGTEISQTNPVHEHVAQMNESDWKFLDRRARMYGYQLFVDDKGKLHFHKPKYPKKRTTLKYFMGEKSQLNGFTVWEEPAQHGKQVYASQVDPLTKELFNVNSQEVPDAITSGTKAKYKGGGRDKTTEVALDQAGNERKSKGTMDSKKIASLKGESDGGTKPVTDAQPRMFLFEEGHHQTRKELQAEVEGFSQHTRWLVKGQGQVIGLETMRAGDLVEIIGVGRNSGEYYIVSMKSKIQGGAYTSYFNAIRTWIGNTAGSLAVLRKVPLLEVPL